ncbi:SH3 domain-containing protein [Entophlyctis helioformis]|nr:SH3 domain-containing protein [Entophlyctis helioformis]
MSAPPPPSRPGKKDIQVVRALYSYTPQNPDELAFEEGDVLYVVSKDDANWWKCRSGDREGMVPSNYLGENSAQIDNPLHEAAKRGNLAFVMELLAAGVSVNGLDKAGNAPLHWACRGGHADVVQQLLTKSPALNVPNKLGDTPLHLAAWGTTFCMAHASDRSS